MAANASDSSNLAVVESSPHRRRSVHFDSSPTEIVGGPGGPGGPGCPGGGQQTDMSGAFPRKQADAVADGIREEEEEEAETDEEDRPPSTSSPPTSSFDPKLVLRRQSAPAASIALGAATSPSGTEADDEVLTKIGKKAPEMECRECPPIEVASSDRGCQGLHFVDIQFMVAYATLSFVVNRRKSPGHTGHTVCMRYAPFRRFASLSLAPSFLQSRLEAAVQRASKCSTQS